MREFVVVLYEAHEPATNCRDLKDCVGNARLLVNDTMTNADDIQERYTSLVSGPLAEWIAERVRGGTKH